MSDDFEYSGTASTNGTVGLAIYVACVYRVDDSPPVTLILPRQSRFAPIKHPRLDPTPRARIHGYRGWAARRKR